MHINFFSYECLGIFWFCFQCIVVREDLANEKSELIQKIEKLHSAITALCPNKTLTSVENITATHGM